MPTHTIAELRMVARNLRMRFKARVGHEVLGGEVEKPTADGDQEQDCAAPERRPFPVAAAPCGGDGRREVGWASLGSEPWCGGGCHAAESEVLGFLVKILVPVGNAKWWIF